MSNSSNLSHILERITTGTHTDTDLATLRCAIDAGQIVITTGERAVAIGENATDAIIVTGDSNLVFKGTDTGIIREILKEFNLKDEHIEFYEKLHELSKAGEILFEWKTLHDMLQQLQPFLDLITISTDDENMFLVWQKANNLIEGDLLQFASQIQFIGRRYEKSKNGLSGEEWAVKIAKLQKDSNDALDRDNYLRFREYAHRMQNLTLVHMTQSNNQLVKNSEIIDLLYDQASDIILNSPNFLLHNNRYDSKEFQLEFDVLARHKENIIELIGIHNLLDRLHIEMNRLGIRSKDKELENTVKTDWKFLYEILLEKLFEEASRLSCFGTPFNISSDQTVMGDPLMGDSCIADLKISADRLLELAQHKDGSKAIRGTFNRTKNAVDKSYRIIDNFLQQEVNKLVKKSLSIQLGNSHYDQIYKENQRKA